MELEHCAKAGCDDPFTTDNYRITSSPRREWTLVTQGNYGSFEVDPNAYQHGRVIRNIDELMNSDLVAQAELTRSEVIAVVLYTGPMVSWKKSVKPVHL